MRAALLGLVALASAAAAEVRLESTLAPPPGVAGAARGLAVLTLGDDGAVRWQLRVADMTGFAVSTALRLGAEGAAVVTLTNPPPSGDHVGTFGPLSPADQEALAGGRWWVHVATAAHPGGELHGRVEPAVVDGVTCACAAASGAKAFRRCVAASVRRLPAARRRTAAMRTMRRAARIARCGPPATRAPRKAIGCCLARTPAENVVVEPLCALVPPSRCERLGGRIAGGTCGAAVCEEPS